MKRTHNPDRSQKQDADTPPPHADPLQPHAHEPNPAPPSPDRAFTLQRPNGARVRITPNDLYRLPQVTLSDCYIVSTGHGTSGPFAFRGPTLLQVVQRYVAGTADWSTVEVISGDGFGTRVPAAELWTPDPAGPIVLALDRDGKPLTREQGAVRLIVPSERDDALRQVKWIKCVNVRG